MIGDQPHGKFLSEILILDNFFPEYDIQHVAGCCDCVIVGIKRVARVFPVCDPEDGKLVLFRSDIQHEIPWRQSRFRIIVNIRIITEGKIVFFEQFRQMVDLECPDIFFGIGSETRSDRPESDTRIIDPEQDRHFDRFRAEHGKGQHRHQKCQYRFVHDAFFLFHGSAKIITDNTSNNGGPGPRNRTISARMHSNWKWRFPF